VSDLENSNKENNRKLNNLTDDVEVQKKNVIQLFKLNDEFRKEMEDLGEQVAELYLLKKSINVSVTRSYITTTKPNIYVSMILAGATSVSGELVSEVQQVQYRGG